MSHISIIRKKIAAIESALSELKSQLDALEQEKHASPTKPSRPKAQLPSQNELKEFYDTLYAKFVAGNSKEPYDLLKTRSVAYLAAFCKVNQLPIDIKKVSKEEAISSIIQWLAQRKAITKEAR